MSKLLSELENGYYDNIIRCLIDKHYSNDRIIVEMIKITFNQYSFAQMKARIGLLKKYDTV